MSARWKVGRATRYALPHDDRLHPLWCVCALVILVAGVALFWLSLVLGGSIQ